MKLKHLFENETPMITDPRLAYSHAKEQIKGRYPEAEPIIMKNPTYAYYYARDVIEGRWPEAEPIIMKQPEIAQWYARDVIKGRWLEAEPFILNDPTWASWYLGAFPEAGIPRSKDVPLVLNDYVITDVPNTITDEQVEKIIKLIEPDAIKSYNVYVYREYHEPTIKYKLEKNILKQVTTKQLLNNKRKREKFLDNIGYSSTDFK